jgi:hypothetical protein
MALLQSLIGFTHLPGGFRNRGLCPQVEAFWGRPYSAAQMTYDLRRLRLKGLIPHPQDAPLYRDQLRPEGRRPNWAALLSGDDRLPRSLRLALDALDLEIQKLYEEAALAAQKTCFKRYDVFRWRCLGEQ